MKYNGSVLFLLNKYSQKAKYLVDLEYDIPTQISLHRIIFLLETGQKGARGSIVVKALCYKVEGRGFDTR
jgi:hypothetical protein